MAVHLNFSSLFHDLNLEDQWLPSKPWESIATESGVSQSESSSSKSSFKHLYDPSTVSEANLVRLAMNALQGVQSALDCIEKLSAAFCSDSADRTFHRISSLWHRSLSTNSLGKILRSIGRSGAVVFLIHQFVNYFLCTNISLDEESGGKEMGRKQVGPEHTENQSHCGSEEAKHPPYSLVNQAFSVAVRKVLEGYISALDTLYTSVDLRRSPTNVNVFSHASSRVGCLTSVVHSEITLLEIYLHTKELRTQIESLGNICFLPNVDTIFSVSSLEDLTLKTILNFCNFPRGGNLLTYLYTQLQDADPVRRALLKFLFMSMDADPVHRALLKFLFMRSCEPYCDLIRSWIYQARISDPYKEFIVEDIEDSPPYSHAKADISCDVPLATIKEQDDVVVPCFLKDFCVPIFRAGQQLQVLIKLLELCNFVRKGDHIYEDILPCFSGSLSDRPFYSFPLIFNKRNIEGMLVTRNSIYRRMQGKLENILARVKSDMRYQQIYPYSSVSVFVDDRRRSLNIPVSFASIDSLISPSSTADKEDLNVAAGTVDSEASSTIDEFSYAEDFLESSENSSLSSSEQQNEPYGTSELHGSFVGVKEGYLSALGLFQSFSIENGSQKLPQGKELLAVESSSFKSCEGVDTGSDFIRYHHQEMKLRDVSVPFESEESILSNILETQYADFHSDMCWPLGGILKNPFYVDEEHRSETNLHLSKSSLKVTDRNMEVLNGGISKVFVSNNCLQKQATSYNQLKKGMMVSYDSHIFSSRKLNPECSILDVNPMLTKNVWLNLISRQGDVSHTDGKKSFSYFDFTSVEDPCKIYSEKLLASPFHEFQFELPSLMNTDVADVDCVNNYFGKECYDGDDVLVDQTKLYTAYSPSNLKENLQAENLLENGSGGAEWECLLNHSGNCAIHSDDGHSPSSQAVCEMPLDVIIDKCILQEILLQYEYVSNLTIKLLEEGFDLHEHLLALRRYHFMELADWADLFIMSLWHHKWYVAEANQRISEIQGILNMAVQRSSCERDRFKDRLFVYLKGQGMMPLSTSAIGIHSFDSIGLGYRVDWPVSIVLTPGALKTYADIFSFLIHVKLALFSLTNVWCSLKDLAHLISQNRHSGLDEREVNCFNILVKLRHQVSHFVSTLQQYVQSQLSHVSWCRFLDSLKHQVKDMMDLESVHTAYLSDALHICFLSVETRAVATIIESILQCAMDFRSCLPGGVWEVGSDQRDSLVLSQISFSQVLAIKGRFDKNLKELHLCYLKSLKREEFSLSRFWGYLNYNEYYFDA